MATPRHAWQRPRLALQRPRHALQRPRHAWQRPRCPRHAFSQGPRSPTSKKNPSTYCLISCEAKGVVYHQTSIYETWWYTTPLISQLSRAKRKNSEVNLEKYKIKILRFDFRSGLQFSILLLYISTVKIK